ncbi:MAG TPA: class I SAM-dependent methyltransferase [Solirubrobacteraceae bacterium]|nr:class I SAM-dependent methyltransferase [Solirubrobacteraceae bacterium]
MTRARSLASPASDHAARQRALWGRRPRDWAEHAEPANRLLFEAVLDAVDAGPGLKLLDVGCGSGLAVRMAADRGCAVAGADATPELLGIARERTPDATLVQAPLEALPFTDAAFDAVIAVNALQFAADPVAAVAEAARVTRGGGTVAATTFAEPERCEGTVAHLAMKGLRPPDPAEGYAPYALSSPGGLSELLAAGGLEPRRAFEVPVIWEHADVETTVLSLLASAGGALAVQDAGEPAVRRALERALTPFVGEDGRVRLRNVFRVATAGVPKEA